MKTKVTTRDLAAACGISQTAVSMILSNRENCKFSEETVRLVKETAERMGYVYKPRKKKMEELRKKVIMIMCPSLSTQYYTSLIQSITEYCQKQGIHTMTAYTSRSKEIEEYYIHLSVESDFYGIIYTYAPKAIELLNKVAESRPVVMINDYNPEIKIGLLELDSKKTGRMLTKHLLDYGHEQIAYITSPLLAHEVPRLRRLEGVKEELVKAGLTEENVTVISMDQDKWSSMEEVNRYYKTGYQLTMDYFRSPDHTATAFIGTNDLVAIGIMDAIKKLGYDIPGDYSVCGFDNTLASSFAGVSLTTVDHCIEEKGRAAVDMIFKGKKEMENGETKKRRNTITRIEYQPLLVVRNSTGKCYKKMK